MTKLSKSLSILCGVILLSFVFLLGYSVGLSQTQKERQADYAAAIDDMKTKLTDSGILLPTAENRSVNGAVTSVGDASLEIEATQLVANPLEAPAPIQRRITVSGDTKITKIIPKTAEEIDAAMKAFDAAQDKFDKATLAGRADLTPPEQPAPNSLQVITLSDIKKGDWIRVTASADITYSPTIAATEISVLTGAAATAPAAAAPAVPAE